MFLWSIGTRKYAEHFEFPKKILGRSNTHSHCWEWDRQPGHSITLQVCLLLQAEKNYTILNSISKILKQNNLEGSESLTLLADKSINKTGWTSVLLDAYDNRDLPVYTSELITRMNTAYHQEMTQVNSSRKNSLITLKMRLICEENFKMIPPMISNSFVLQPSMKQHLLITWIDQKSTSCTRTSNLSPLLITLSIGFMRSVTSFCKMNCNL